jgi:hypothetical protein
MRYTAKDASTLNISQLNNQWEETCDDPSSVSLVIANGTGSSKTIFSDTGSSYLGNTQTGLPNGFTSLADSAVMVKTSSGATVTQRGPGVVSSHDIRDHAKIIYNVTNEKRTSNGDIYSLVMSGHSLTNRSSLGSTVEAPNGTWKTNALSGKAVLQSRDASAQVNAKQLLSTITSDDATASHTFQGSLLNAVSDDLAAFDLNGNIAMRADSSELAIEGKASLLQRVGADIAISGSTLGRANDDLSQSALLDVNGGSFLTFSSNLSVSNGTLLNAVATTLTKIETSTVSGGADGKTTFQIAELTGKGLELTSSVISSPSKAQPPATAGQPQIPTLSDA